MANAISLQVEREQEWLRYWETIKTEEGRSRFLLFLKERRDLQRDSGAAKVFPQLVDRWVKTVYKSDE